MASEIQIPQRTPPPLQFQGAPTDLINALYNRPKQGEIAANSVNQGVSSLLDNYYKGQQLKAQAFGQGGPVLMSMLYGNGQPTPPASPQVGSAGASNAPSSPDTSAQTFQGQPAQPSTQGSISPIEASLNHRVLGPAIAGNLALAGNPALSQHQDRIRQLQFQMGQNAQMGAYGQKLNQGLTEQLGAEKALMEGEQFNVGQQRQAEQFNQSQAAEESRFQRGHIAGVAEKAATNLANTGTIQDDISSLRELYKGYKPMPFIGSTMANVAGASGKKDFGTATMQQGNQINQVAPKLGAEINYELTRRFSPGESALLMARVAPTATDDEANASQKLDNLQRLVEVFKNGDQAQINMVATAIAGKPVRATVPTGGPMASRTVKPAIVPDGRITVKSPTGKIGHIPASQLKQALAEGYVQQ